MSSNDEIPTLDEIIFPGRPEKVAETQHSSETTDINPSIPEPQPSNDAVPKKKKTTHISSSGPPIRSKPRQSNFEALINTQVERILQRHINAARDEIVKVVMIELRSRLPNTKKRD